MSLKIGIGETCNVSRTNYMPCLAEQKEVEFGYYNRTPSKKESP